MSRWFRAAIVLFVAGLLSLPAQIVPNEYVVELAQPTSGTKIRGARAVRSSQLAARQAIASRFGARATVTDSVEIVMNALFVHFDADPAQLEAIPGVSRVWPVYRVYPNLEKSLEIISAVQAWQAIGGIERAGAGVKIGVLDTGLQLDHPGFRADGFQAPPGFPKFSSPALENAVNGKVIVYRSYDRIYGFDESARDFVGHGTAVSMVATGIPNTGPAGEIRGVAPAAWLGVYKVFAGPNGIGDSRAIIRALDDSVADGMDVLNLSIGIVPPHFIPERDPVQPAIERAAALGVMCIKAAGNEGPFRSTLTSPYMGMAGLTVGGSRNARTLGSGVQVGDVATLFAVPSSAPVTNDRVVGPIADIARWDPTGLACNPLPAGVLTGRIALILRGECFFEDKMNVAQAAGAIGAIVYTHAQSPDPSIMNVGANRLPSVMLSNRDGVALKRYLAAVADEVIVTVALAATLPFPTDPSVMYTFSSRGPGVDGGISPDLLAIGQSVYTAAQSNNPEGSVFGADGYTLLSGTSFAAPMVSGAYALLKGARPGLKPNQYKSLLVNAVDPFSAPVQVAGAGRLNVNAALQARLAAEPVSVSFGVGSASINREQVVRIDNVSSEPGLWRVKVDTRDTAAQPQVEPSEFSLDAGASIDLRVRLSAAGLPAGELQGFLLLERDGAAEGERPQRIAYWYGIPGTTATAANFVPEISPGETGARGEQKNVTILVTDDIGAPVSIDAPRVSVVEGSGSFVSVTNLERQSPGYWRISVRLGNVPRETNRFRVEVGPFVREFAYTTQ